MPVAKDLCYKSSPTKDQTRENSMALRYFKSKTKARDSRNSESRSKEKKETFISYVKEYEDVLEQLKDDSDSVFVNEVEDSGVFDTDTMPDYTNTARSSSYKESSNSPMNTSISGSKSPTDQVKNQVCDSNTSGVSLSSERRLTSGNPEDPIYQVPPSRRVVEVQCKDALYDSENLVKEKEDEINQLLYSTVKEYPECGQYETPMSPDSLKQVDIKAVMFVSDASKSGHETNDSMLSLDKISQQRENTSQTLNDPDDDGDYIDMQGTAKPVLTRGKYMSCSAIDEKMNKTYKITERAAERAHSTRSAPPSPSLSASRLKKTLEINEKGESGITETGETATPVNIDTDEYICHDPLSTESTKTPKAATVTPYKPETEPPKTTSPLLARPFFQYTVEEVVQCFEMCALHQVAKVCKDESLDGEYFQDLSDEDLSSEPFCLSSFHIGKIQKIIDGWRPKRLTS